MSKRAQIPSNAPSARLSNDLHFGITAYQQKVALPKINARPEQPLLAHSGQKTAAPPVYRPQPVPRVLQARMASAPPSNGPTPAQVSPLRSNRPASDRVQLKQAEARPLVRTSGIPRGPSATPAHQAQTVPKILARKMNTSPWKAINGFAPQAGAFKSYSLIRQATVQRFRSNIVQATRYYPNLHPGAVEPIEQSNIFRLNSFADQYRLHKVNSHGVNVPNQQYNFVRTGQGEMLLHARYRHPSIAEGRQVLYAGEIFFNNGKLQWWSNGSGHYQPDQDSAEQANLPMDHFFSYQQVIKGE